MAAIPPELSAREDSIAKRLALDNSSGQSKLRKIYALIDELGSVAAPYLACKQGCSDCCRMNVTIFQDEANYIERATGIKALKLENSIVHPLAKFSAVPCTFLKDNSCAIYEVRPLACRKHWNFDSSAYWCAPERSTEIELANIEFTGPKDALRGVVAKKPGSVVADIRDFFPI